MVALRLISSRVAPFGEERPRGGLDLDTLGGRFVELSGHGTSAVSSVAFRLVLEGQRLAKNVAWVGLCQPRARPAPFFAPDVAASGVDLAALPVVLAPGPLEAGRAASHLLRSGAFALVVLDLENAAGGAPELPLPLMSRLTGLAQTHGATLLALTDKPVEAPSLGSLVSLHAHVTRARVHAQLADGHARYEVVVTAHKDKRHGPGWTHREVYRAPAGIS